MPGVSGNPGGKPAIAEVSALARRYTADWVRGLVDVVRLPAKDHASAVVAAARELREVGYPGLTKGGGVEGAPELHLHLLAVTSDAQALLGGRAAAPMIEAGSEPEEPAGPPLDEGLFPAPDGRLPHEALPLWDAAGREADRDNDG